MQTLPLSITFRQILPHDNPPVLLKTFLHPFTNESDSESFNLMSSLSHPTQQKPQTPEESAITTQSEAIGSTITPARAPFIYLAEQSKTL